VHKAIVAESKKRARQLFVAKGVSTEDAKRFFDIDSGSFANRYRIVLDCQSEKESVERHRKITVSHRAD
jgi:hypothetical protein